MINRGFIIRHDGTSTIIPTLEPKSRARGPKRPAKDKRGEQRDSKKIKIKHPQNPKNQVLQPENWDIMEMEALVEFYNQRKHTVAILRKEC